MSAAPPFIIWTLQRTGGTNLASQLIERSGLAERRVAAAGTRGEAEGFLGRIVDGWSLHEPFNAGAAARIFGDVTTAWHDNADTVALDASLDAICSLQLPFKHCVEMVPAPVNARLAQASCRAGFRHVFLYRRNATDRLLSMQFARLTGLWGAQLKGSVDYAGRAAGIALPVEELLEHERLCLEALATAWHDIGAQGGERIALAFEDIWGEADRDAACDRLLSLLCFLGLDHRRRQDQDFVERILGTGRQDTRDEYAAFLRQDELAAALQSLRPFAPRNRFRVLSPELIAEDEARMEWLGLDDYPEAPRAGSLYAIGGIALPAARQTDDRLVLVSPRGEHPLVWDLASPGTAARFPHNPAAGMAGFRAEGLCFPEDAPLDIRLVREGGRRVFTLLRLRCGWRQDSQQT